MGTKTSSRDYDSQEIDNLEHDPSLHLKKTMPYGWTGSAAVALKVDALGNLSITSKDEIFYWDDTTTANVVYLGYAAGGSATSASVWKIAKVDTSSKNILLADGNNNYDNKWDDRASLSYS